MKLKKVMVRMIFDKCFISMINNRTLKRICALEGFSIQKSELRGMSNTYYFWKDDTAEFVRIFTERGYSVEFI